MKILCLGNNTEDTDIKTRELAATAGVPCYGLLSELEQPISVVDYTQSGYYHSSVYDLQPGKLKELLTEFDQVVMLDQPKDQWSHPYAFNNTIEAVKSAGQRGIFINPKLTKTHDVFDDLTKNNKSFCIFPFIHLYTFSDGMATCCRSSKVITKISEFTDWQSDPHYQELRQKMISGVLIPEHCGYCYQQEDSGIMSPRQVEMTEWAQRLDITSVDQLVNLKQPAYYDIRPSNKCNLLCRMCNPDDSHLIAKEYKTIGINYKSTHTVTVPKHYIGFDVVDLDTVEKLSVAGGEPSIMAEFLEFLQKCIELKRTDFEISITTNANKFSTRFKELLAHFSNVNFIVSIDGFQDLNHYIRYPSNWDNIIANLKYLKSQNRQVSVHTTISIYNVSSLHLIFEYLDREFPNTIADWDFVDNPSYMAPHLFPDQKLAITSLTAVTKTNCYKNAVEIFRSRIDTCLDYFVNYHKIDQKQLKEFFIHNDLLDQSRSIWLVDHVPALDKYRSNIV
jgi:sulfatase maturation enzyme AslB (radical SAM superfamily)